jgi:hypothetical protein
LLTFISFFVLTAEKMVDRVLPFLTPIKRFVLRIGWDSLALLQQGKIKDTPLLFLAGDADTLVPHEHMLRLRDAAHMAGMAKGRVPTWHVIKGGTHNESWVQGGSHYWQAIANFVRQTSTRAGTSEAVQSMPVNMDGTTSETTETSSIPIMKDRFMGMARDAWSNRNSKDKNT